MGSTATPHDADGGHTIEAEIFSAGRWNGETFSVADLKEIARNFHRLKATHKPPLKFGHDAGQTLTGQKDGDPALGWVAGLRVRGDKLVATFQGLPGIVVEAIRQGRYRSVSAELYFRARHKGRMLGKVLKAVALLGADLPAVRNLRDLAAYLASEPPAALEPGPLKAFTLPTRHNHIITASREETNMPDEEHNDALLAELAELRAYKERQDAEQHQQAGRRKAEAFRSVREEALNFCEAQVRAGRLPPGLKDALVREIDGQGRSFAEGGPLRVTFGWVRRFLEQAGPMLPQGELGFSREDEAAPPEGNPSQTLARLAADKMTELGISYGEASEYILRTRPELAAAYRDFTLNPIS